MKERENIWDNTEDIQKEEKRMAYAYGVHDLETPIQDSLGEAILHGIVVSNLAYFVGKEMDLQEQVWFTT